MSSTSSAKVSPLSALGENLGEKQVFWRREAQTWWRAIRIEFLVLILMILYFVPVSLVENSLVGDTSLTARRNATLTKEEYSSIFGNLDYVLLAFLMVLNYFSTFEAVRYHWKSRAPLGIHVFVSLSVYVLFVWFLLEIDNLPKWVVSLVPAATTVIVTPVGVYLVRSLKRLGPSKALFAKALKRSLVSIIACVFCLSGIFYGEISRSLSNLKNFWVEVTILGIAFPLLQLMLRRGYFAIVLSSKNSRETGAERRIQEMMVTGSIEPVFTLSVLLAILNLSTEFQSFFASSLLSFAGEVFETWWLVRGKVIVTEKIDRGSQSAATFMSASKRILDEDVECLSHFLSDQQTGRKLGLLKLAVCYLSAGNEGMVSFSRLGLFLLLETVSSMCKFSLMENRDGIRWTPFELQDLPWGGFIAFICCGALGYFYVEAGLVVQKSIFF